MNVSTDKFTIHIKVDIPNKFNIKSEEFLLNKQKFANVCISYPKEKKLYFLPIKYQIGLFEDYLMNGALLLKNRGIILLKMRYPKSTRNKKYITKKNTSIDDKKFNPWPNGSRIIERMNFPCSIKIIKKFFDYSVVKKYLNERRNRNFRKIVILIDFKVLDLQRISFWKKSLGNIKLGNWKFLDKFKFEDQV